MLSDLDLMRSNLEALARRAKTSHARVLLVGMRLPPNYGTAYGDRFAQAFARIAREQKVALVPYLLDGVGEDLSEFQADRIHPTAQAQPRILENVWAQLEKLLRAGG